MRDPIQALDLDLAIATRARREMGDRLRKVLDDDESDGYGRFFTAVLLLLSE